MENPTNEEEENQYPEESPYQDIYSDIMIIPIPKNVKYFEPYMPDMKLIERAFGPNGNLD